MGRDKKNEGEDVARGYEAPEPKEDHERVGTQAWQDKRSGGGEAAAEDAGEAGEPDAE